MSKLSNVTVENLEQEIEVLGSMIENNALSIDQKAKPMQKNGIIRAIKYALASIILASAIKWRSKCG